MTTVNLVNPFWGKRKFTYWRMTGIYPERQLNTPALWEVAFASTAGGANLLASAVSVTAPGVSVSIENLYDGNVNTFAAGGFAPSRIPTSTSYIQAQFAEPVTIAEVRVTGGWDGSNGNAPLAFAMAASSDGSNWVGFGVYTSSTYTTKETKTFAISGPDAVSGRAGSRIWLVYRDDTSGGQWAITELAFSVGAGNTNLATGGTPVAVLTDSFWGPISNAFDGNLTNRWQTASVVPSYIGYVFATPPNPTHYRITATSAVPARAARNWKVYYLNNGATWVEADARDYVGETITSNQVLEFEMSA